MEPIFLQDKQDKQDTPHFEIVTAEKLQDIYKTQQDKMIKEIILTRHTRHKFTLTRHYILHIIKHLTVLSCLSCLSCRNM